MIEVYCHTSPSGKRYVGYSTRGSEARWRQHVSQALLGSPTAFHRAIRKYGEGAFKHAVLAQCACEDEAKAVEVECIAAAGSRTTECGYNETAGGEGAAGYVHDEASRSKNRLARLGKKLSAETIAKRSAKQRGAPRHYSPESKAAISAAVARANSRRVFSPEQLERMRAASTGRRHSDEVRAKMSAAWTPEMRAAAAARLRENNPRKRRVA